MCNERFCPTDEELTDHMPSLVELVQSMSERINAEIPSLMNALEAKKEGEDVIATVEFLKISHGLAFLEDAKLLLSFDGNALVKERHADLLLRAMAERTIEFLYLLAHPESIADYFGANASWNEKSLNAIKAREILNNIDNLTQKRFKNQRKSVSAMAKAIGEKRLEAKDGNLSLYSIYRILSQSFHHAYFLNALSWVDLLEEKEEKYVLTDTQKMCFHILYFRFMTGFLSDSENSPN